MSNLSCGHVWMWELDCEEGWAPKNWCLWTVVLEKTLESPLDCKEIQPVHSEGDQPWDFFGGNDAEAETTVLWPPHAKSWLIGKDSDAGGDWGQEEKGKPEDEMAGWHHWLYGLESEWTPGVGDGQGGLVCCDSWLHKDSDMMEQLNWTELNSKLEVAVAIILIKSIQLGLTEGWEWVRWCAQCFYVGSKCEVAQSCSTLCDPMDCSLPGSSVHGIFQARILEWIAFPSPGDLPDPGIEPGSPAL